MSQGIRQCRSYPKQGPCCRDNPPHRFCTIMNFMVLFKLGANRRERLLPPAPRAPRAAAPVPPGVLGVDCRQGGVARAAATSGSGHCGCRKADAARWPRSCFRSRATATPSVERRRSRSRRMLRHSATIAEAPGPVWQPGQRREADKWRRPRCAGRRPTRVVEGFLR